MTGGIVEDATSTTRPGRYLSDDHGHDSKNSFPSFRPLVSPLSIISSSTTSSFSSSSSSSFTFSFGCSLPATVDGPTCFPPLLLCGPQRAPRLQSPPGPRNAAWVSVSGTQYSYWRSVLWTIIRCDRCRGRVVVVVVVVAAVLIFGSAASPLECNRDSTMRRSWYRIYAVRKWYRSASRTLGQPSLPLSRMLLSSSFRVSHMMIPYAFNRSLSPPLSLSLSFFLSLSLSLSFSRTRAAR